MIKYFAGKMLGLDRSSLDRSLGAPRGNLASASPDLNRRHVSLDREVVSIYHCHWHCHCHFILFIIIIIRFTTTVTMSEEMSLPSTQM